MAREEKKLCVEALDDVCWMLEQMIAWMGAKGDSRQEYTRSNFFIKGGEVTTPTIMGDIFPPCDVKNTLIELNNQLPNFPHMPAHLSLAHSSLTLHDVSLNLAHC